MDNTSPPRSVTPIAAALNEAIPLWNQAGTLLLGGVRHQTNGFWIGADGDKNDMESTHPATGPDVMVGRPMSAIDENKRDERV
jgi:hypothetical protein